MLPLRTTAAEDEFVDRWRQRADDELALGEAISAALDAGRPQLAARLVGLMPAGVDVDPDLARARSAARLVLHRTKDAPAADYDGLIQAWTRVRQRRMSEVKARLRRTGKGDARDLHRTGRGRKPR